MKDKIKKILLVSWAGVSILILSYALYLHLYWILYWPTTKWWGWEWDFYWILGYFCVISFIISILYLYFNKDRILSH